MPMSKGRKKDPAVPLALSSASARPARALTPSPTWYPIVLAVVLVIGLAYLVAYYPASDKTSFMIRLGAWNFAD